MWQRIGTGVVGGGLFVTILWIGGNVYVLLLAILATIAYREFCYMYRTLWYRIESLLGWLYIWTLIFSIAAPYNPINASPFEITVGFLLVWMVWTVFSRNRAPFQTVGTLFAGAVYIGVGFAYMTSTRFLSEGVFLTLFVIVVTWASDTGAFLFGKKWGKTKLSPTISPNKTVVGACAALLSACLIAILFRALFFVDTMSIANAVVGGVVISIVGQIGDLVESALKRSQEIKDSGHLLPGHGGVLDRFDSLLFTFPVLHLLHLLA